MEVLIKSSVKVEFFYVKTNYYTAEQEKVYIKHGTKRYASDMQCNIYEPCTETL